MLKHYRDVTDDDRRPAAEAAMLGLLDELPRDGWRGLAATVSVDEQGRSSVAAWSAGLGGLATKGAGAPGGEGRPWTTGGRGASVERPNAVDRRSRYRPCEAVEVTVGT